jgi:hypothetical protein
MINNSISGIGYLVRNRNPTGEGLVPLLIFIQQDRRIVKMKNEKILCEFGCGNESKFLLKNGKHCCSKLPAICPTIKEKTRITLANRTTEKKLEINEKRKQTCLKNMGVEYSSQTKEHKNSVTNTWNNKSSDEIQEIRQKIIQTNLEKYGVTSVFFLDNVREKIKQTMLERYGVVHNSQSDEIKNKKKQTCLVNWGVEYPLQSGEIRSKYIQTCLTRFGVEHPFQSIEIKEKIKKTCLINFGVENPSQSIEIKNKKIETCLKNWGVEWSLSSIEVREKGKQTMLNLYGVEHPMQSDEIRNKYIQTCLINFGVMNSFQSEFIKNKIKNTMMINWGVENPSNSPEIRKKAENTCLKLYGHTNAMHNDVIAMRALHMSYSTKDFILPSGKIIKVQGFEPFALKILLETYNETQILTGVDVPRIDYADIDGKQHKYFPDIYIPEENKIIEIKSCYTVNLLNVDLKANATRKLFNYEIWVMGQNGEILEIR